MPIISLGVPAFSSSDQNAFTGPSRANATNPAQSWVSGAIPAWIAYDLSASPSDRRQKMLAAWYAPHDGDYISTAGFQPGAYVPVDYTLEVNSAAGGTTPPANGWIQVASVVGNVHSGAIHSFNAPGANWLRMNVLRGSDPSNVTLNLDVYSAAQGPGDSWLFMGDSITHITFMRAFSNLPSLVRALRGDHIPAVLEAGIGGTRTIDAVGTFDKTVQDFPGKFVVLSYGTNDDPSNFQMETLVQKVIALGKTPVVPHMPWADGAAIQSKGPIINGVIDGLYGKYPQILRGPDLWEFFKANPSYIPPGDVHPNSAGQEALRHQWATVMASVYQ